MYNLVVKEGARKALHRLPAKEVQRLTEAIAALRDNPRPLQCVKLEGMPNAYRLRKGDYRILYTIDENPKLVTVYRISHRREAYR